MSDWLAGAQTGCVCVWVRVHANVHVSQTNDDHHKVIVRLYYTKLSAPMWITIEIDVSSIPFFFGFFFLSFLHLFIRWTVLASIVKIFMCCANTISFYCVHFTTHHRSPYSVHRGFCSCSLFALSSRNNSVGIVLRTVLLIESGICVSGFNGSSRQECFVREL